MAAQYALEKVAESIELPCKYNSLGCQDIFSYHCRTRHEEVCKYHGYNCLYAAAECCVPGDIPFLVVHLKADHNVDMHNGSTFNHLYVKPNPHEIENARWMLTLNLSNAIEYLISLPHSAYNQDTQQNSATGLEVKTCVPIGTLPGSAAQENQTVTPISTGGEIGVTEKEPVGIPEGIENRVAEIENAKQHEENINPEKVEEGDISNDEKAMRLFKVALVEFVKELLKPKWKEGKMSRDVHKTVVKKVVDKVTTTIQGNQVPRTQAKIEQYLASSKPKITKLVEAYVERLLKE